jgi:hypothetical protein
MNKFAMRSVWNRDLPPAVRLVTKYVRAFPGALAGVEGLEGFDMAGAEALAIRGSFSARLKVVP